MPLTRQDALRLLRFCLGPDDSGSVELADDGAALVTISPAEPSIGVRTFEAPTFEAALRQAADARLLKAACVEKQIVFLEMGASKAPADAPAPAAPARRARPDLFPKLLAATASLLHETQTERGMSAIFSASSGRIFKRELGRQRERVDLRRERFKLVRRELGDVVGGSLARRARSGRGADRRAGCGAGGDRRRPARTGQHSGQLHAGERRIAGCRRWRAGLVRER
jgi:hypothetical protein